ncbi:MAG: transglycosylase SLT domain-containing protein [Ignavibacterium album]|uniref:transglycosylase SLT domain-containing protein n=1 Tax=Ignavibacterium album TaxID=591197 RepID=UPI0026EB7134|nr:transglycosylase SLT domain-containing protein [Ignavibacterium album]MCX8106340.1 transglycosylase SLT domain-containing protein [Ignavibacterium album]
MSDINLKITNPNKHISQVQNPTYQKNIDKKKLADASKQFESLLTSMMLKSMSQTTGGLFGEENFGGDFFESIFQYEIANQISKGKGLGVADMIYKKITGESIQNANLKKENKDLPVNTAPKIELKKTEVPALKPTEQALDRVSRYESIIEEAAQTHGVDKNLIKAVILAESAGKENALSTANAKGLMQLIDATADYLGVRNVWNPKENIFGGTKYLAELLRKYDGDLRLALAGYNAGPGNVDKYNDIPPFTETQTYVKRVMGYLNHIEASNENF